MMLATFSAKTETSNMWVSTRRPARVVGIAKAATATGSSVAVMPRKK